MMLKEWNRKAPRRGGNARQRARGFTLVELLLVLIILALIGGLVLPNIIGRAEGAKVRAASSQIDRLAMAVETYYMDTNSFPDSLDGFTRNFRQSGHDDPEGLAGCMVIERPHFHQVTTKPSHKGSSSGSTVITLCP